MELSLFTRYQHLVPRSKGLHMTLVGQRNTSGLQGIITVIVFGLPRDTCANSMLQQSKSQHPLLY